MTRSRFALLLTATSLVASGAAVAQATATPASPAATRSATQTPAQSLNRADIAFLKDADHAGRNEIEASGMALERASNAQVKAFAKQMSTDHAKAGDELKQLAQSKGVELPGEPSLTQQAKIKLLSAMKGERFDRQYADEIGVDAHEATVKLFREAATNAKDPDVKAWATKTLPKLEHHLEMARGLKQTVASQTAK